MDDFINKQLHHFDRIADTYHSSRQVGNHLMYKELLWNYFLGDKSFFKNRTLTVLEPMCGYAEGYDILKCHMPGVLIDYTGFDLSRKITDKVRKINGNINVFNQDITEFKSNRQYDLIILIGGLHHVHRYVKTVLSKLYNALKPSGYFINFEPTNNNISTRRIRAQIYKRNNIFDASTEKDFTLDQYNRDVQASGFDLIDQIYPGLVSYILYYNPDAFPKLNIGSKRLVLFLFNLDKKFFRNTLGRKVSFCTLSLWQKKCKNL